MKTWPVLLLFLFFACFPCHAQESGFLEDISGVFQIRKADVSKEGNNLVLRNCAISFTGIGDGTVGVIEIADEQPGKVGSLVMRDVSFPGLIVRNIGIDDMSGNFAAIAPVLPMLLESQMLALTNPEAFYEKLPMFKALMPALKKFQVGQLKMSGLDMGEKGTEINIKNLVYNKIKGIDSWGPARIEDVRVRADKQLVCTIAEIGWEENSWPGFEALLQMNPQELEMGTESFQQIQQLLNMKIKNGIIKNARIPLVGVSLAESRINIDSENGKFNFSWHLDNLHLPGMLLALAQIENGPETVAINGNLRIKSEYDEKNLASIQRFSLEATDLFSLSGQGGIDCDFTSSKDNFVISNANLSFKNQGIIAGLSGALKKQIENQVSSTFPYLTNAVRKLLSGQANNVTVTLKDSTRLDELSIEVN